jgi:NTP pyrophosphatase (non-canonical NTP hydrolase)
MDAEKGFHDDLPKSMILLTGEVGEVAQVIKKIWWRASLLESESGDAMQTAINEYKGDLGDELADCLAYIFKLANNTGIDLEQAYLAKMERNLHRTWTAPAPPSNPAD